MKLLFKLWEYILSRVHTKVDMQIKKSDEIYVVYYARLSNDVYLCKGGDYAIELYNVINKLNMLTNRPMVKVLYGPAHMVFRYKIVKVMDMIFTWDASIPERQKIYNYIADVPLGKVNL